MRKNFPCCGCRRMEKLKTWTGKSGEGFIDGYTCARLIALDAESSRNLFLAAELGGTLADFFRC